MNKLPSGLYALCDDSVRPELSLPDKARLVLDGGARVLQLRMKRTATREALAIARGVAGLCRQRGAICVIDDRVDLVLLSNAHGVHIGDRDIPCRDVRRLLGPERFVGVTTLDAQGIARARDEGADHVGLGPVFPTATKSVGVPPLGLERFSEICSASPLPVIAISGITLANITDVARAGAHGAAVCSDLLLAPEIPTRARELARAYEAGRRKL